MLYDILVTQEKNKRYTARVLSLPDIVVSGTDEIEVLKQVRDAIASLQTRSRIVRLNVPTVTETADDPWLRAAGMWENDPDWDLFEAEVQAYRQSQNTQTN